MGAGFCSLYRDLLYQGLSVLDDNLISDENASFTNSKFVRKLLQQFLFIFVIYFGIFPHLKQS